MLPSANVPAAFPGTAAQAVQQLSYSVPVRMRKPGKPAAAGVVAHLFTFIATTR